MGSAISDMLPFAVAIAVSPIPVLAVVFMLMSDAGRANAFAFLAGWAAMLVLIAGGVAALGIGGDPTGVAGAAWRSRSSSSRPSCSSSSPSNGVAGRAPASRIGHRVGWRS